MYLRGENASIDLNSYGIGRFPALQSLQVLPINDCIIITLYDRSTKIGALLCMDYIASLTKIDECITSMRKFGAEVGSLQKIIITMNIRDREKKIIVNLLTKLKGGLLLPLEDLCLIQLSLNNGTVWEN